MSLARRCVAVALLSILLSGALPVQGAPPVAGWGAGEIIETDNAGNAQNPQIAVAPDGTAFAIWRQSDGTRDNIWANRYVPGSGWGIAALIETDNAGNAQSPQIAVDPNGPAFAVWRQSDGTRDNIWANRYVPGSGWGSAALIEANNAGNALEPQVGIDGAGNATAVWRQFDGARDSIWANRYVPGTGWGSAALIETDNAGNAQTPQVAVDPAGNAVAVWRQFDGTRDNIWANRYVSGSGWGSAALIETDNAGTAQSPQVAVDGAGNAVAVWRQSDGTRDNILANWYVPGSGWGIAALIETDNAGNAQTPQVAVDGAGNATAVWRQSDGTRDNIWANRFVPGSGWGSAALIETYNTANAIAPQVAVDPNGTAFAVWYQGDGARDNIWANRFVPGSGWGLAGLIEMDNAGNARDPQIAVDSDGSAFAVWRQADGFDDNIWANRYTLPDVTPPAITLSSPSDGATAGQPSLWVSGTTEAGATVSVNGALAIVAPDGSFGVMIALAPGPNTVTALATDAWGNAQSAAVNVTCLDPIPGLLVELADARAALNRSLADLAAAQVDLAAAEANLSAANLQTASLQAAFAAADANLAVALARVSALEGALLPLQQALDVARSDLNASAARVAAIEADQDATQAELDAARFDLTSAQGRVAALEGNLAQAAFEAAAARANVTALQSLVAEQEQRLATMNATVDDARQQSESASASASQASSFALVGVIIGLVGAALAVFGIATSRKRDRDRLF